MKVVLANSSQLLYKQEVILGYRLVSREVNNMSLWFEYFLHLVDYLH